MSINTGCPFCAKPPATKHGKTTSGYSHHGRYYAHLYCCCGGLLPSVSKSAYADTPEEALKRAKRAWETRAPIEPQ